MEAGPLSFQEPTSSQIALCRLGPWKVYILLRIRIE